MQLWKPNTLISVIKEATSQHCGPSTTMELCNILN